MRVFDRFGRLIGFPVTLPYYAGVLVTNGALLAVGGTVFTDVFGYRMPAPGWVVMHTVTYTVDLATSGFGVFLILINGVAEAELGVLRVNSSDGIGPDGKHALLGRRALTFKAGDVLGATWDEIGIVKLSTITGVIAVALAR